MLYEVTCFKGINEVKTLLFEHIWGSGQRVSEPLLYSSYIISTQTQRESISVSNPTKSHPSGF